MAPLLQVEPRTKRLGGLAANRGVSLAMEAGEIVGLIGPNGAGKTTLFNCITGSMHPDDGRIVFDGMDVTHARPERICRLGVARTWQVVRAFGRMTALDNVVCGALQRTNRVVEARARATELLEFTELRGKDDAPAATLTLADKKRLEIARALATRPKLLLLDEAMSGLTPIEAAAAVRLVRRVPAGPQGEEVVALIGANGAGKTTLLKAIAGLVELQTGVMTFHGQSLSAVDAADRVKLGVALVPEGRRLFNRLSVAENLTLGSYSHGDPTHRREMLERIEALFPVLRERARQRAGTLSGGEAQMLAIARALMSRPRFLMLDEPSLGIMPRLVAQVVDSLRRLQEREGLTMFLVEQNVPAALDLADRGYVLQTGRVVLEGRSEELRGSDLVRKAYLGM